ncbi:hypothetical protein MKX07_008039 [Trichoderma sp. CBMAI-0711]|uniref:Sorbitol dehydrogenase n=1 Tax=Trichoderma parareesei TaxID=858221 RepID=A0A2H2ZTB4_TRIPA|nr:hypothetical protein MKX07_008039 [Trichoderma sp. CBMAI-0711]OTA08858.1 sorbitol dehydrogenase [Trichoderma parareesei]
MCASRVKAAVLHGERDLRLEERRLPPPEEDEVQVAIQSTGLCGSDLHYFNHFRNGDILVREPLTLGHESSGIVVAIGEEVRDLKPGDRVALEVGLPCEHCEYCEGGRYNICKKLRFRSSAKTFPHLQGTLQERINHPARWTHKLPDSISLDQGALVEPLSVALHSHRRANLRSETTVLVFGAGTVGLLTAAVSKVYGASTVVVADIQRDRVDFAIANGFADAGIVVPFAMPQTLDERLSYAQEVARQAQAVRVNGERIGEYGAAYECTGVEVCLQSSIYATKPGGRVMVIGMGTPNLIVPMGAAALREIDLVGVFRYANTYSAAIEMISNKPPGLPDLEKLVTHRFKGMDEIKHAFEMAGKIKDGEGKLVIKVVVDMS